MASNMWLKLVLATVFPTLLLLEMPSAAASEKCSQPERVCAMGATVFIISSFEPFASAVRLSATRLVTNRHSVGDVRTVTITTQDGRRVQGEVVPTAFEGDLIFIDTESLEAGPVATLAEGTPKGDLFTVAGDIARKTVRAYPPGQLLGHKASTPRARLHHNAYSQPGNSGGALVDETGALVGIVASGGEGRFEAIPVSELAVLEKLSGPAFAERSAEIGQANRECVEGIEAPVRGVLPKPAAETLFQSCAASANRQLFDVAAQKLARGQRLDMAVKLAQMAVARDPAAVNSRLTLVIALHIAGRYADEIEHLNYLIIAAPEEPAVARYAIQAGKWGGDVELARKGLELVRKFNPAQVEAAERFLKADVPPPVRRTPAPE